MVENNNEASDTVGCTLYSCLILEDYVFVVVSSIMQLITLGSFALSEFPGGNVSLKGEMSKSLCKIYVTGSLFMVSNIAFLTSVDLSHLDVSSFWRVVLEISARHDTSDRSSLSVKLLEMVDDQHDNVGPAPPKSLSQQPLHIKRLIYMIFAKHQLLLITKSQFMRLQQR